MKEKLQILKSKEVKQILKKIESQWGFDEKLDYAFLMNKKNRVFIVNRDISKIDLNKLRINSVGLYFCEYKNGEVRPSIEGSQILGPSAKKNVLELNDDEVKEWMKGEDLNLATDMKGFLLVKHNDDFMGSGKYKDGKILNFVPKARRLRV